MAENVEDEFSRGSPALVALPDAHRNRIGPPPLKIEVEESSEGMSPRNMWQVYALGGFMVLRWIWARWKERKNQSGPSDEPDI